MNLMISTMTILEKKVFISSNLNRLFSVGLCPAFAGLFVYIIHDLKGISYKVRKGAVKKVP